MINLNGGKYDCHDWCTTERPCSHCDLCAEVERLRDMIPVRAANYPMSDAPPQHTVTIPAEEYRRLLLMIPTCECCEEQIDMVTNQDVCELVTGGWACSQECWECAAGEEE